MNQIVRCPTQNCTGSITKIEPNPPDNAEFTRWKCNGCQIRFVTWEIK